MLKTVKVSVILVVIILSFSQVVVAREFADIYTECGIGAMIAPNNEAVAAVTNVTWDLGTTAVSSNISSPGTCAGGKEKTAAFIYDSYESLEKDLAKGNGEYLDTLMALVRYESEAKQDLIIALRNDFAKTVAAPGYTTQSRFEKSENLYNLVYKHVDGIS